ncbi:MAG: flagellar operon protein [Solirubrobacterales bacterium]|nr:flagellar operon protein [Solirubrobacterales bacterium]
MSPISNPALVPPGGLSAPLAPTHGVGGTAKDGAADAPAKGGQSGPSFADALTQAGQSRQLQFSKHALARVERRGIDLDASTLGRLSQGVERAASKGSRDSLVLVDGTAFVVSVNNRTVITAVGSEHMKDNVFTNIDSAVIA